MHPGLKLSLHVVPNGVEVTDVIVAPCSIVLIPSFIECARYAIGRPVVAMLADRVIAPLSVTAAVIDRALAMELVL